MGYLQKRGNSYRIRHYVGFIDNKRVYQYHPVDSSYIKSIMDINGHKSMDINMLKLSLNLETSRAGSLARIGHEPPKLGVVGSNPTPPAKIGKKNTINKNHPFIYS